MYFNGFHINFFSESYDINDKEPVQLATFDPDGHGFAYVYLNNIYYMSSVQDESPVQVTTDGEDGVIYNGVPDWVYEGIFTSSVFF